jgi:hypothetical protein
MPHSADSCASFRLLHFSIVVVPDQLYKVGCVDLSLRTALQS